MNTLRENLRRHWNSGEHEYCDADELRNPDGPEAADLIDELAEALEVARQLIESWSPSEYADKSYKDATLAEINIALAKVKTGIIEGN